MLNLLSLKKTISAFDKPLCQEQFRVSRSCDADQTTISSVFIETGNLFTDGNVHNL